MGEEDEKTPGNVEALVRGLGSDMARAFQALGIRIGTLEDVVGKRFDALEDRVDDIDKRVHGVELRPITSSLRVREIARHVESEGDLANASRLADQMVAHKKLEEKVDALGETVETVDKKQNAQLAILRVLEKAGKSRVVRSGLRVLVTAAVTWLALHMVPPGQVPALVQSMTPTIAVPAAK